MGAHILDLLSAPGVVGLAHVGWGLNGRDELQSKVSDTGEADNRTGNVLQDMTVQHERADEDVNFPAKSVCARASDLDTITTYRYHVPGTRRGRTRIGTRNREPGEETPIQQQLKRTRSVLLP